MKLTSKLKSLTKQFALVAAIFLTAGVAPVAKADVSNVVKVTNGDASGKKLGYFEKKADGTWFEQGIGDRVIDAGKTYKQAYTDEHSIFLWDKSRGVVIQINLHEMVVTYGDGRTLPEFRGLRPIYKVVGVERR